MILSIALLGVPALIDDRFMQFLELLEGNRILDALLSLCIYALLYILLEYFLKGKTLGKFITQTRVVTVEGKTPDFASIVSRSFARIVPFEPFSFFGDFDTGWHDRWSSTIVIDEKLSHY